MFYWVALDPAGPRFKNVGSSKRLDRNDAKFVNVLHTDDILMGTKHRLGDVDFYVNGGEDQPGCRAVVKKSRI